MNINRRIHDQFRVNPVYTGVGPTTVETPTSGGTTIIYQTGGGSGLTDEQAAKLAGIEDGAQKNQNAISKVTISLDGASLSQESTEPQGAVDFKFVGSDLIIVSLEDGNIKIATKDDVLNTRIDETTEAWVTSKGYTTETWVNTRINEVISGAPDALDTLYELAAALGNDPNFSTTVLNKIGTNTNSIVDLQTMVAAFQEMFEWDKSASPTDKSKWIIKAKSSLYSVAEVSAYGYQDGEAPTGAQYMYELKDVLFSDLSSGQLIQWNGSKWVNIDKDAVGLNESELASYLTTNNYAKKTDITSKGYATEGWVTSYLVTNSYAKISDITWVELDDKPSWIGSTKPSYSYSEITGTPTVAWVNVTGRPMWIDVSAKPTYTFAEIRELPTTLEGYGIVDGVNALVKSGAGNAITGLSISGHTLTYTTGSFIESSMFNDLFEKVNVGTASAPVYAIKAKYHLFSVGEVSAYGFLEEESPTGAQYMYELKDVTLTDISSGQLLQWNGSVWVNIDKDDVGLNESELAAYLTTNNYAKISDITWSEVDGKPTWIGSTKPSYAFSEITGKPTTLSGYGITDAVTLSTVQRITNSKTFASTQYFDQRSINFQNATIGGSATGLFWQKNGWGDVKASIGVFTAEDGDPSMYMGWGVNPWGTADNFHVSSSEIQYKGNNILHQGNYTSYLDSRYVTSLGVSNDYLTWTKDSSTNSLTIPYAGVTARLRGFYGGGVTTAPGTRNLIYSYNIGSSTSGIFPVVDNANALITMNTHNGNYFHQLGISSNGNLYHRAFNNTALNTTQTWVKLLTTGNYTETLDNRYYTESEADSRFVNVTGDNMTGNLNFKNNTYIYFNDNSNFSIGSNGSIGTYLKYNSNTLTVTSNSLRYNNNTVWHAGNDGSGSGLDADLLDGRHRSNLYYGISDFMIEIGNTISITVAGDVNTYYPVYIYTSGLYDKNVVGYMSIYKNLGSPTANYPGNHSNGTSSLWVSYEYRSKIWDGNGGYIRTKYMYEGYATLISEVSTFSPLPGIVVWLRGGGTQYYIAYSNGSPTASIYYSETNLNNAEYPVVVAPRTNLGNRGAAIGPVMYTNVTGTLYGNATTATTLQTARSINGTNFNGSANIVTSYWGTTRSFYINSHNSHAAGAAVSVNGNGNVTLLLPNTISCSDWFRSTGNSGWYHETYGGGIWMTDSTYVKVYNKDWFRSNRFSAGNSQDDVYSIAYNACATSGSNWCCYSIVRQSNYALGIGFTTGNEIWLGTPNTSRVAHSMWLRVGSGQMNYIGSFVAQGEVTAYSDVRLKSNITDLTFRGKLRPRAYVKDNKQQIGFVAQEVQALYPELILETNDESHYLALNYGNITAVLSSQINVIDDEVTVLKKRIKQLENKLEEYVNNNK